MTKPGVLRHSPRLGLEGPVTPSPRAWILGAFVAVQLLLIFAVDWGPQRDEAFYAAAGLQLLRGETGDLAHYLGWFNGSPFLWPVLSGVGHEVLGYHGSRLVALLTVVTSVVLLHGAARRWVGPRAADLGAGVMLIRGSSAIMGHYATYDVGSLLALALATRLLADDDVPPRRILAAGLLLGLGAMTKYPYALMGILVAVTALRFGSLSLRGAALFAGSGAAVFFAGSWLQFGSILPTTLFLFNIHATWPRLVVALVMLLYTLIPIVLILLARRAPNASREDRTALAIGLGLLLVWPLLHLFNARITSAFKHVWVASMLLLPFIGLAAELALRWVRADRWRWAVVGIVVFSLGEWIVLQPVTYPDHQVILEALDEGLRPGDRTAVVGDNDRWLFTTWLYSEGWSDSPVPREVADLCEFDWVVSSGRSALEPPSEECVLTRVTPNSARRGHIFQPGRIGETWRVTPLPVQNSTRRAEPETRGDRRRTTSRAEPGSRSSPGSRPSRSRAGPGS